jgi:hypothetical protein
MVIKAAGDARAAVISRPTGHQPQLSPAYLTTKTFNLFHLSLPLFDEAPLAIEFVAPVAELCRHRRVCTN